MDSESVGTWEKILEIQGFERPAEYVLSAVTIISAETDYFKEGWKDVKQNK
jgi:hypothetical protein